jgi:SAM-dependent methyltransferase
MSDRPRLNIGDLDYIFGYYPELSPSFLSLAALLKGYRFTSERAPRYLELGFGRGVSINMHAAACPGVFWGNDFAPNHVAFARTLAQASGAELTLTEQSFQELAARDDLPEFDLIVLHGVWSWISDRDRAAIVDLVRRNLAPGGLLYVSYNCLTSWAPLLPVRQLMIAHASADRTDRPLTEKVRNALDFTQSLIDQKAQYFNANPFVTARLNSLRNKRDAYLAHEFFAAAWEPTSFADVSDQFGEAGLTFAGTTALIENIDAFSLTEAGRRVVAKIDDPVLRECVRETFMNTQFRKDIFIKQASPMTPQEQDQALWDRRFVLSAPPNLVALEVDGPMGKVILDPRHFGSLLSALAADAYAPKTVSQLSRMMGVSSARDIVDQLSALVCGAYVHAAPSNAASDGENARCRGLNRFILEDTARGGEVLVLASAAVGGAVRVPQREQLFLRAMAGGAETAQEMADLAWPSLRQLDGAASLERAEIVDAAEQFRLGRAPVLSSLGVI